MLTSSQREEDLSRDNLRATSLLIERLVVVVLFGGLLFGVAQVLMPFVTAILFGTILVIATWPLRQWVVHRGISRGIASFIMVLGALLCLVVPAISIAPGLGERLASGMQSVQAFVASAPEAPEWLTRLPLVGGEARTLWSRIFHADGALRELARPYATQIGKVLLEVAGGFVASILQVVLSLAVAMMLWLRGDVLAQILRDISERLAGDLAGNMLKTVAAAVRGVAYGVVGTAVIQTIAMTIGLMIAGVPHAGLLGFLSLMIAISQFGIFLVVIWGAAAWWLFSTDQHGWGVFMLVWGLFVSTVDNVIRPWLVSFGASMPLTLTFLGVFGGFVAFGFLGLFIGPTLLAILYALLDGWRHASTAGASQAADVRSSDPSATA
jgi:predicted PurR-regulated permease PerM